MYTLNEALLIDQYILNLASYETSNGLMIPINDVESLIKMQKETQLRFYQFKKMIRNGECTIEELERMVIDKNGPIYSSLNKMTYMEVASHYAKQDGDSGDKKTEYKTDAVIINEFLTMIDECLKNDSVNVSKPNKPKIKKTRKKASTQGIDNSSDSQSTKKV